MNDPLSGGERGFGEEAGDAIGHAQHRLAVDRAFEAEAEEPGFPLSKKLIDANVVLDPFADRRQSAVEGDDRIEQAIDGAAAGGEVDAEKPTQEKVRLARFD